MNTLDYIVKKYEVDLKQNLPIKLKIGRYRDLPNLFNELGFRVGAEVGVFRGLYSKCLLERVPGLKLFGVDTWSYYYGYKDYKNDELKEAYEEAKENIKGHDCLLIKGKSREVVEQFEDESLDFVYIDANHSYEYVVEDIALWSKKVKKGGIVSGHDYNDFSKRDNWNYMQVVPAVNGWMQAYKINPWFILINNKNNTWMYVK